MSPGLEVLTNTIISTTQDFSFFTAGFQIVDIQCDHSLCEKCLDKNLEAEYCQYFCTNCEAMDISLEQTISCQFNILSSMTHNEFQSSFEANLKLYAQANDLPIKLNVQDILQGTFENNENNDVETLFSLVQKRETALLGLTQVQNLQIDVTDGTTVTGITMKSMQSAVSSIMLQDSAVSQHVVEIDRLIEVYVRQNTITDATIHLVIFIVFIACFVVTSYFTGRFIYNQLVT